MRITVNSGIFHFPIRVNRMVLSTLLIVMRCFILYYFFVLRHTQHMPSKSSVELQPTLPICESSYSKNEEFFLFSSIMEATMIDKKLNDKSIYFELSIGNAGNSIDGHNESQCNNVGEDGELDTVDTTSFNSTTNACKPISNDKFHYYLPYWDYKPCMNVRCLFPDLRRRMYNSNMISKFVEALVSYSIYLEFQLFLLKFD